MDSLPWLRRKHSSDDDPELTDAPASSSPPPAKKLSRRRDSGAGNVKKAASPSYYSARPQSMSPSSSDASSPVFSSPPPAFSTAGKPGSPLKRVAGRHPPDHNMPPQPNASCELEGGAARSIMDTQSTLDGSNRSMRSLRLPRFLSQENSALCAKFNVIKNRERLQLAADILSGGSSFACRTSANGQTIPPGMNRYHNIKPFDHNRIRLRVPSGQLDYVNASKIDIGLEEDDERGLGLGPGRGADSKGQADPRLRYIAMQGPTEESCDHVWRMIAEMDCSAVVIVQLTPMVENEMVKCHQYFPAGGDGVWVLNEADHWRDGWRASLQFEHVESLDGGAVHKTRLVLRTSPLSGAPEEERSVVVWHLLYTRWPDYGVPAAVDTPAFWRLMALSRELSSAGARRIVHCSAGVGRTGTFIAMELLRRMLEANRLERVVPPDRGLCDDLADDDPVFRTVCQLREQRMLMVACEKQFLFIYAVLRNLWLDRHGHRHRHRHRHVDGRGHGGEAVGCPSSTSRESPTFV